MKTKTDFHEHENFNDHCVEIYKLVTQCTEKNEFCKNIIEFFNNECSGKMTNYSIHQNIPVSSDKFHMKSH